MLDRGFKGGYKNLKSQLDLQLSRDFWSRKLDLQCLNSNYIFVFFPRHFLAFLGRDVLLSILLYVQTSLSDPLATTTFDYTSGSLTMVSLPISGKITFPRALAQIYVRI